MWGLVAAAVLGASLGTATSFQAHPMVQYDHAGQSFGARGSALRLPLGGVPAVMRGVDSVALEGARVQAASLAMQQRVLVVRLRDATEALLSHILVTRPVPGVLFLLPSAVNAEHADWERRWAVLEAALLSRRVVQSVFFAWEDADLAHVADVLDRDPDGAHFSVDIEGQPLRVPTLALKNLHALLRGRGFGSEPKNATTTTTTPTIAIVAHLDVLTLAPTLRAGVDASTTGVAAMLSAARMLAALAAREDTRPTHNVLFLLPAGGSAQFAGARAWLDAAERSLLESVEFVLCLDALGRDGEERDGEPGRDGEEEEDSSSASPASPASSPSLSSSSSVTSKASSRQGLVLHVSRPPKTPSLARVYNTFHTVADRLSLPLVIRLRRPHPNDPWTTWAHEPFAQRRLPAGTLSHRADSILASWSSLQAAAQAEGDDASSVGRVLRRDPDGRIRVHHPHSVGVESMTPNAPNAPNAPVSHARTTTPNGNHDRDSKNTALSSKRSSALVARDATTGRPTRPWGSLASAGSILDTVAALDRPALQRHAAFVLRVLVALSWAPENVRILAFSATDEDSLAHSTAYVVLASVDHADTVLGTEETPNAAVQEVLEVVEELAHEPRDLASLASPAASNAVDRVTTRLISALGTTRSDAVTVQEVTIEEDGGLVIPLQVAVTGVIGPRSEEMRRWMVGGAVTAIVAGVVAWLNARRQRSDGAKEE